jgi:hypothetical protein
MYFQASAGISTCNQATTASFPSISSFTESPNIRGYRTCVKISRTETTSTVLCQILYLINMPLREELVVYYLSTKHLVFGETQNVIENIAFYFWILHPVASVHSVS